ncbi:hypothetical protein MR857_03710 [bacterium]|nr:hypothetical protein [bacterium]MDY3021571.1 hypothetical protein [Oliverpabstia sp.]
MFEQNDFHQLAEMVSRAVVFQLDTSILKHEKVAVFSVKNGYFLMFYGPQSHYLIYEDR